MTALRPHPGIRVVRTLARDPHLETLLVRVEGEPARPAVLAHALDESGERLRRTELVALERARGAGVVELLDVVDEEHGPALLLAHHAGPRLADHLEAREEWTAGEAVAVLAPLTEAVGRMHAAGVAHGRIAATGIAFDGDGRPVLTDLSRAAVFTPGAPEVALRRVEEVGRDRRACRELAVELLTRVTGSRVVAAAELVGRLEAAAESALLQLLDDALAELAAPIPLPPEPSSRIAGVQQPSRVVAVVPDASADVVPAPSARAWLRELIGRRLRDLPPLRRRLLLGGGTAVAVAAVLLAVVRAPEADPATGGDGEARTVPATDAAASRSDIRDAAIDGDDPVSAAIALLDRREDCFRELSLLCLEDVDQAGSAALASDRAAVQTLREGREAHRDPIPDVAGARVVERLGDSVLLAVGPETAPASLLIMRGEAGWRIRDWIAVETVSETP